jgi:hypothetical protein
LWNALPGVEKQKKVGDRAELIDELWTAIEALPEPEPQSDAKRPSKAWAHPCRFERISTLVNNAGILSVNH